MVLSYGSKCQPVFLNLKKKKQPRQNQNKTNNEMTPPPSNQTNKQTKRVIWTVEEIPPNYLKLYKHDVDGAAASLCSQIKKAEVKFINF